MTSAEIDWLYPSEHVKDQVLGNVFGRTFSDSFRREYLTASPLSGQFAVNFLSDLVFSTFVMKLVTDSVTWNLYPRINLTFLGIIDKSSFLFLEFWLILSSNKLWRKIFRRDCDWGLIVVIVYYFQLWSIKNITLLVYELSNCVPCLWSQPGPSQGYDLPSLSLCGQLCLIFQLPHVLQPSGVLEASPQEGGLFLLYISFRCCTG